MFFGIKIILNLECIVLNSGGSRISRRGAWASCGGGGMDSQGGYVSKILYVKMKESGPLGGSANAKIRILESLVPEF